MQNIFFYQFPIMFIFNSVIEDVRKMDGVSKAETDL